MKITRMKLIGVMPIDMPIIGATTSDRYLVKNVDGLGPPPVDVYLSKNAQYGGFYQGSRPENRQIIVTLGLNPEYAHGETHGDLRTELYGLYNSSPNNMMQVQLLNGDTVELVTFGWVSKMEPTIFDQEPAVQITIDSDRPFLEEPEVYEAPLPIPSTGFIINNRGTAPTGMTMVFKTISAGSTMEDFYLYFGDQHYILQADSYGLFRTNEITTIETQAGIRSVMHYVPVTDDTFNFIWTLHADSIWPQLNPGDNLFTADDPDKFEWESISFKPKYWGI